jgi:hypothetical protein
VARQGRRRGHPGRAPPPGPHATTCQPTHLHREARRASAPVPGPAPRAGVACHRPGPAGLGRAPARTRRVKARRTSRPCRAPSRPGSGPR